MTMDTFSHIIDSLIKNDPVQARMQIRELMRSGTLAEEHWAAVYTALRLTTTAIEGRGHYMYADTKKAWRGYYAAQALEELRKHVTAVENGLTAPAKPLPATYVDKVAAAKEGFTRIIDLLADNNPVAARKQINLFARSGNLPHEDWPALHNALKIVTKAIDGRGDYMYADTRKAWWDYYTNQAREELCEYLGWNQVVQFPVFAVSEPADEAA